MPLDMPTTDALAGECQNEVTVQSTYPLASDAPFWGAVEEELYGLPFCLASLFVLWNILFLPPLTQLSLLNLLKYDCTVRTV